MPCNRKYQDIGSRLHSIRYLTELNQKDFSSKCGFIPSKYNNWEKGERQIPVDKAIVITQIFGITLDYIYLGKTTALPFDLAIMLHKKAP